MPIQKTEAILLRKRDLRETSLILSFFTRGFGKVDGVLKGARGARPRSDANPLFFSLDQLVFYEKKRGGIFVISQCEAQEIFMNILKSWNQAASAYYMLELVDVFTEPGEKSEEIFDSLTSGLRSLDATREAASIIRLFEIKLLMTSGLWPGTGFFNLSKGAMSSVACFENEPWQNASKIRLTKDINSEIRSVTKKIIEENLDRPLKTVRFL